MKKLILFFLMTACIAAAMVGCSKSSDAESSNDLTLSGTLSSKSAESRTVGVRVQYELYKLYCVTFEEVPSAGSGDADNTGYFELKLDGAKNKPFGCFVQDKATSKVVATLVFEDTSKTGMDGSSQQSGQISLTGSAGLGTIVLDFDKGVAVVDMANIQTDTTDTSEITDYWDFTGTWNMKNSDIIPTGYDIMPVCADNDHGPCMDTTNGMQIYLKRVKAKEVSTQDTIYGIMVWDSLTAYQTCGSKLGFTNEDAIIHGNADFSEAIAAGEVIAGQFDYYSGDSGNANCGTIIDGWKCSDAIAENNFDGISQGERCDKSGAPELSQLRCYSNAYWKYLENDPSKCIKDVRFDWSATSANDFVKSNNKAKSQFVFEKFVYTSATSGSFSQYNEWVNSMWTGTTSINCKLGESMKMNTSKVDDTTFVGDMEITSVVVDDYGNTECSTLMAQSGNAYAYRFSLKFTKQ